MPPSSAQDSPAASFDLARRGYDRDQVDARLRELQERLASVESARNAAEQHALATEDELRAARAKPAPAEAPGVSQGSFGFRAEKILRMAEHEAAEIRTRATREAAALVERARGDAERHRHEAEQAVIARSAERDKEAARRSASLQEREQHVASARASAQDEATRLLADARRTAEALVSDATNRAEEIRQRSEQDLRRRREIAEHELRRIGGLQESTRGDMARLHVLLTNELSPARGPSSTGAAAPGSRPGAVPVR